MQQDSIDLVDILSLIYWLIAVLTISKQGTLLTGATSITLYAAVLHTRKCHVLFQFTPPALSTYSAAESTTFATFAPSCGLVETSRMSL